MPFDASSLSRAASWLRSAREVVVFTGAGVSAESGISTFRDDEGFWRHFPVEDFATWKGLVRTAVRRPRRVAEFIHAVLQPIAVAKPNAGHRAIADLEKHVGATVVTQNAGNQLYWDWGEAMAMFVHLTPEKRVKSILRNGITRLRKHKAAIRGVFAMPVMRNFYVSHQWLRELKRRGQGAIVGVYFRIADEETVWVGHYNQAHQQMTAAAAATTIHAAVPAEGFEVIIPRHIDPKEIHRTRRLPQVVGWRYYPGSHGKRPCGCPFCQRGEYGARRLREKYESGG